MSAFRGGRGTRAAARGVRVPALLSLSLALLSCGGRSEDEASKPDRARATDPFNGCRYDVPAGQLAPIGRTITTDLDGDGGGERVYVAAILGRVTDCRYALAAEFESETSTAPLREPWIRRSPEEYVREFLHVDRATPIDDVPGDEVVVNVDRSASRQWAAIFTARDGALKRFRVERDPPERRQSFAYGGSLISLSAVDCRDRGTIVTSFAGRRRHGWQVARRFLRVEGLRLVQVETRNGFYSTLTTLPEFALVPTRVGGLSAFARCS
jgi:hypothetical protein